MFDTDFEDGSSVCGYSPADMHQKNVEWLKAMIDYNEENATDFPGSREYYHNRARAYTSVLHNLQRYSPIMKAVAWLPQLK